MSHLSLYRKFRPRTFEGIVRQEHVVRILRNQIAQNAIAHAYLFTGPRGTGKTTVARIFARAVNCEHPKEGSPCGKCATCRALEGGSLDITEIDAASNNGVNEMRDLREKVQYPPVSGRYKVYIVDEVHMLTDSAFNALLKTLEEPPAHAIFILATTEPQKIPATILSRCMRLDFKLIPEEDLKGHLKGILKEIGKDYEEEAVAAIARAGAGSDRDMLSIAEACIVYSDKLTYEAVTEVLGAADFHETAKLVSAMLRTDLQTALDTAESILNEGKSVGVLLKDILSLLGQVTVAKTCRSAERLLALPAHLFAEVKEIADGAEGSAVLRATEIFIRTENELRFASSPRISLEAAIMRAAYPQAEYDIDALTVRIGRLEEEVRALAARPASAPAQAEHEAPAVRREEASSKDAPKSDPAKEEPPFGEYDFPTEEPVFEEAYFSDAPIPPAKKKPAPKEASAPPKDNPSAPPAESIAEGTPAPSYDAGTIYAKFMRELRKTAKSGVLFTMCRDLNVFFEEGKLILETDSEAVYGILGRDIHRATMTDIFTRLGVSVYEVRLAKKGKAGDPVEELKKNFGDYPIEIR